jgi:serine/threonine-protein kinase
MMLPPTALYVRQPEDLPTRGLSFTWSGLPPQPYVPPVVLVSLQQAVALLAAAGVSLGNPITYAYSSTIPVGYVISQTPSPGEANYGTLVYLTVSNGPAPKATSATVPNVVGRYYYDAQLAILDAQCTIAAPNWIVSATVEPGYVISQSVAAGTVAPIGEQVLITVSKYTQPAYIAPGAVNIPNVSSH